jgi:hypothetical protein
VPACDLCTRAYGLFNGNSFLCLKNMLSSDFLSILKPYQLNIRFSRVNVKSGLTVGLKNVDQNMIYLNRSYRGTRIVFFVIPGNVLQHLSLNVFVSWLKFDNVDVI